jgi:hypothetical protein
VAVNAVLWAVDLWAVVQRIFVWMDVKGHWLSGVCIGIIAAPR